MQGTAPQQIRLQPTAPSSDRCVLIWASISPRLEPLRAHHPPHLEQAAPGCAPAVLVLNPFSRGSGLVASTISTEFKDLLAGCPANERNPVDRPSVEKSLSLVEFRSAPSALSISNKPAAPVLCSHCILPLCSKPIRSAPRFPLPSARNPSPPPPFPFCAPVPVRGY